MTKKMKERKKERWKDGKMGQKMLFPGRSSSEAEPAGPGDVFPAWRRRLLSAERPQLQRVARFITFI